LTAAMAAVLYAPASALVTRCFPLAVLLPGVMWSPQAGYSHGLGLYPA